MSLKKKYSIPFNKPSLTGQELKYIKESVESGKISGDGLFTEKCHELLQNRFKIKKALLTTSCTHALEMSALLLNIKQGDEIIVPSFTFVSTANAYYIFGARPVFVDIRPDTLNIDEKKIEQKITKRTKAILPVHYAGIGCEMDRILDIARKYDLKVVEDAAQGVNARYSGKYLGSIGHLGAYSFHETKNFICGEGGALIINDDEFMERAEIIREKGTNRSQVFRGEADKYTWLDRGSSYLPSDIVAAFLFAQLQKMDDITKKRNHIYQRYVERLSPLENEGLIKLPYIPPCCETNFHLFYLLLPNKKIRDDLIVFLADRDILALFHYLPLHLSPIGLQLGYAVGDCPVTEDVCDRLLRLPFYNTLTEEEQNYVIDSISKCLKG